MREEEKETTNLALLKEKEMKIWEGKNSDGDTVTLSEFDDGLGVSFDNKEEGYGGGTVIPKKAYEAIERYFYELV